MKPFCPYRQAGMIQAALSPDKMRTGFLIGAGCPASIRTPAAAGGTSPLMPDIAGLTSEVRKRVESDSEYEKAFAVTLERINVVNGGSPNIEELLSCVRAIHEVAGPSGIDGVAKEDFAKLDKRICELTTDAVAARLPDENTPYHQLASWIGGIRRNQPIEVFTPNYDLLMEQALEERRVPYFDGFIGGDRTFFDLASIEQDSLPTRWARLWKLHGSVNWWRTKRGEIQRRMRISDVDDRQMIYPSHLKYDESRRMPYLAMLDRLRSFLSRGQAVLITCGYSFNDQHLNEVILEGLNGNATAICFGLLYGELSSSVEAIARAKKQANLSVLAVDGAVIGTIQKEWQVGDKSEHPLHGIAVKNGPLAGRTSCPDERNKFLLGDFAAFGRFLAQQLAETSIPGAS